MPPARVVSTAGLASSNPTTNERQANRHQVNNLSSPLHVGELLASEL
jgi:hypothetical protein